MSRVILVFGMVRWCFFSVGVIVVYAMCLVWCVDDIFYISVMVLLFLLRVWYGVMFIFGGFVVFVMCLVCCVDVIFLVVLSLLF